MQPEEQPVSIASDRTQSDLPQSDSRRNWPPNILRLVLGAVVAAGLGWVTLKNFYPIFVIPPEIAILPDPPPTVAVEKLEKFQYVVDGKNYSIVFGIIGAIFGISCVVFSFGVRSSKAIIVGSVGTAVLGIVGANLSHFIFHRLRTTSGSDWLIMGIKLDGMAQTILGYAMLWGLIGLGVGIGIGTVRSAGKSMVAGISGFFGGVLASMTYVLLTSQFSPNAAMNSVFPSDATPQAIWLVLFCVVIATCIALGSGERKPEVQYVV